MTKQASFNLKTLFYLLWLASETCYAKLLLWGHFGVLGLPFWGCHFGVLGLPFWGCHVGWLVSKTCYAMLCYAMLCYAIALGPFWSVGVAMLGG